MSASWESASGGGAWYYYSGLPNPMCTLLFNCMISLPDSSVFACAYMEMVERQVEYTVAPSFLWHLAAEQCWASVLKLWIIYKQKYLQRSVDAHVGVTARKTLLMEVRGCHCECACEIGRRDQSKEFKMWIVWISKGLHERLWCPACSYMTLCLWHDIHYGTGMSHNGFGCLHFSMCLHTCVFDCVHSSSKFSSLCGALQCPLLIHSQNGCCQAEKLPSRVLMGLNRKLSSVGFIELIAYMSGVILFS